MSWFDLSTVMHRRGDAEATRIAVQRSDITIRFGRELIGQLGWSRGDKVTVIVGRDEHFGLVRLAKGQSGWTLQHPGGSSKHGKDALVKLGRMIHGQPALPELPERLPATPVETTVDAGMVEFRLPWLPVEEQASAPVRQKFDERGRGVSEDKPASPLTQQGAATPDNPQGWPSATLQSRISDPDRIPASLDSARRAPIVPPPAAVTTAPPERVGPPTPRSIPGPPGEQRDLAEVETATRDPSPRDNPDEKGAFGRMSAAQTEEFVQAVARGDMWSELGEIVGRSPGNYAQGSVQYLKEKLAHRIKDAVAAIRAERKRETAPAAKPPVPAAVTGVTAAPAGADAAEQPTGPPPIPETTLKFLREEIVPVMASLGHKVTLSDDKTQLYLQEQGAPAKGRVTADALVSWVNALLELEAEEALTLPSAA